MTEAPVPAGRAAGAFRPVAMRTFVLFLLAAGAVARPDPADARAVGGPIRAWVVHVDPRMIEELAPAHRDLVAAVPDGVQVYVGVPAGDDGPGLRFLLDPAARLGPRLRFLPAEADLTAWARDRYLVVGDRLLLASPEEDPFVLAGDRRVGELFAAKALRRRAVVSELFFEGGDVVFAGDHAFTGHTTILENARLLRVSEACAKRALERQLGRRLVVVGAAGGPPHEHCDMYLSVVGSKRVLVGDPNLALADLPPRGGYREDTQRLFAPGFDAVAAELRQAGFDVTRIPLLIGDDGNFRTWNNAVTEARADGLHAYVPRYGLGAIDRKAHDAWRRCGFRVHPVSCAGTILHGGAIRCLTHTIRRPLAAAATLSGVEPARR